MTRGRTSRARRRAAAADGDVLIPERLYFRIGEVSELTQTKAYVLRYWETEFPMLRPAKSPTGHRLYRRRDVEMVLEIRQLLYQQGFTIDGARKKLAGETVSRKESQQQKHLFESSVDGSHLRAIRQELRGILTMLSRKC
jgi:DNA-binding transcriptional MerR regulator